MSNYNNVQTDLYILNTDLITAEQGGEVEGYVYVSDQSKYILVSKYALQPSLQVDNNTYMVTLILK